MTRLFRIITLGCKVNQYESAYLHERLTDAGWQQAKRDEKADVSIINTCIVTQAASRQSRQEIRRAVRANPGGTVIVTGCYAQVFPDELSPIDGITLIAGNTEKGKLPEWILNTAGNEKQRILTNSFGPESSFEFLPIRRFSDRSRAFLKIQDGCRSFCSYCIVPYARGPCRSLAPRDVLSMIEILSREGYQEVILTGIHLGKYGTESDHGTGLTRLLQSIGNECFPVRIRLSSIEINEIDMELVEMMAVEPWLCRHLHIPMQSGDAGVLKRMNRTYSPKHFVERIVYIHERIPLVSIGVDVMAGFPGEDPVAHQNTCALIRDLPVSYLHVFPFSPRSGTPAAAFKDQVDRRVIRERAAQLRTIGKRKKAVFYQRCLKKQFKVLPERRDAEKPRMIIGHSDNYLPVIFPSTEVPDRIVPVWIEAVEGDMMIGSMAQMLSPGPRESR
ncbi:MAG: tRNA (N(6)-L-threonylcarbamoyladenosine(37)-C(2))-methylthiotransferase MtaB [Deltaproteobacteria bacterium]|nr:MAG: tRNA (N(6)-L-threonylcarbamoyladenosine(37)-C(2))-methylthiotransferase MtaB [Deltaproteobacteria bacterium]